MTMFIMSIAMAVVAIAVGIVVISLSHNYGLGMVITCCVFVGYIMFAARCSKRTKLKVK